MGEACADAATAILRCGGAPATVAQDGSLDTRSWFSAGTSIDPIPRYRVKVLFRRSSYRPQRMAPLELYDRAGYTMYARSDA